MRKDGINFLKLLLLGVLAMGVAPAGAAFYSWSKSAGSNATADATINWAEGMAPSAVNDSARAMMARLKEWGDDAAGALSATGTSTSYSLFSNQGLPPTPADGVVICFTPTTTNSSGVTLSVDGGSSFPIQAPAGTAISNGSLVAASPYCVVFRSSTNSWVVRGFFGNPYSIPLGAMIDYTGDTAPNSNFVIPFGQAISRTSFASYFALIGTRFGPGDGVTTFNVPDLRGRISALPDNAGGVAANRLTNAATGCGTAFTTVGATCTQGESHTLSSAEMPAHNHAITDPGHTHTVTADPGLTSSFAAGGNPTGAANPTAITSSSNPTGITINNTGGGTAHSIVQPTMAVNKILRVL